MLSGCMRSIGKSLMNLYPQELSLYRILLSKLLIGFTHSHPRSPLFFTPQFAFTVTAVLQLLCNIVNANQRVKTRLRLLIVNVNMQLTTLQII